MQEQSECFESTYEELKLYNHLYHYPLVLRFESTYEELKQQ